MTHIPNGDTSTWDMIDADRFFCDMVNYFKENEANAQYLVEEYSDDVHFPHHDPTYSALLSRGLIAVMDSAEYRRLIELYVARTVPAAAKNYARVHDTNLPRLLDRIRATEIADRVEVRTVIERFVQAAGEELFTEGSREFFEKLDLDITDEEMTDFLKGYYRAVYYALHDPMVKYLISTHVTAQFSTPQEGTD